MKTAKIVAITLAAVALVVLLTGIIVLAGGFYNVAASEPHTAFMSWIFTIAQERSIKHHATGEAPDLAGHERIAAGAGQYHEDCVICHAAPGIGLSDIAAGMYPLPPVLYHVHEDFDNVEVYWIIAHGIKMTGMPAFRYSHSENELWDMVAFLNSMPGMSAEEYRHLLPQSGTGENDREHQGSHE